MIGDKNVILDLLTPSVSEEKLINTKNELITATIISDITIWMKNGLNKYHLKLKLFRSKPTLMFVRLK